MTSGRVHRVELHREIPAPVEQVWGVLVDPARQPAWLGGFRFEGAWQVGEPFALVGDLEGEPYREEGTLLVLEPPRRLRYTHHSPLWRRPGAPAPAPDIPPALLTLTVVAAPGGARVELVHELPDVEAIVPHARFFWGCALYQLAGICGGDSAG